MKLSKLQCTAIEQAIYKRIKREGVSLNVKGLMLGINREIKETEQKRNEEIEKLETQRIEINRKLRVMEMQNKVYSNNLNIDD